MSKKSERRHLSRSKRKKIKGTPLIADAQQQEVAQASGVSPIGEPAPLVREASVGVTPADKQPPDVSVEVRRIGILAGIILSVLVVLALVLP